VSLKITVYRNAITWSHVDGFESVTHGHIGVNEGFECAKFESVTQGHVNVCSEEDKASYLGDIINEVQEVHGVVGLEIDSKDIAI